MRIKAPEYVQGKAAMIGWARQAVAAIAVAALPALTGCGTFFIHDSSSSGSSASGDYVYVANASTDSLAGFAVGAETLTAVANSPYALSFSPTAVAVNPANTILFVASDSLIYAYAIQSGGSLSVLNGGSAVGFSYVTSMDISPDGQWLFALDGNGVGLDEFQINSTTGQLTQQTGALYSVSGGLVVPHAVKVAPNGEYVFAALGTAGELVFPFNTSTGGLSTPLTLTFPSGSTTSDNALAVSPGSSYLYIARSGTSGGVAVYAIGSGGALSEVTGSPFAAGNDPYSVVQNVAGTYLYVANQQDSDISGYSIASNGTLTALAASPYSSGSAVVALTVDNSGDYLLAAAHGGSPDLTMYSFDAAIAGKLDLSTSAATGIDPTGPIAIAATH